jgi:hypothetical protein
MKINKNSRSYQWIRSAYYMLWRQNPHVYRLLLPLKLLSMQAPEGEGSKIRCSPQRIRHVCNREFGDATHAVQGGDWDRNAIQLSSTWIYGCVHRFLQLPQRNMPASEMLWVENTDHATALDRLLAEKTGGFKALMESIASSMTLQSEGQPPGEILACVGRRGQLLCAPHLPSIIALAVAQLRGYSEIAGTIATRHKTWQRIRQKFFVLADSAFSEGHGALYQQLWHPDLMDVPHLHGGDDRAKFIEAAARKGQPGTALDIGANLGFFCHQLEDLGFRCHAIENNAVLVDHMRVLRDMEGKTFKASCVNILGREMDRICSQEYDIVLALAIFHHFLKSEKTYEGLKSLLRKLKMNRMVLQTHKPEETQMLGAFKNLDPEGFADHIIGLSCLTQRQFMGTTHEGRHVFLLSKS